MIDQFIQVTSAFGIKPIKSIIAAPFNATTIELIVPDTDATPLYINDIVKTVDASDSVGNEFGIEYCTRAAAADSIRGIVVDFKVIHEYENSTYRVGSTRRIVRICQDPFLLCQARINAVILTTDVNRFIDIDSGVGNISTGISSIQLDYASINDNGGQFRITKILDITNTADNQYTVVECIIQKHEFLEGVVSSGDLFDRVGVNIVPHTPGDNLNMGIGDVIATDAHFTGKLTVDGLIDPTGMQLTPQAIDPGVIAGGFYYDSVTGQFLFKDASGISKIIYSNPLPTTTAVGGIPAGSNFFNTPKSYADFVLAAAYAYINPAFTAFAITGLTTVEVGTKITGSQSFTWAISTVGNVQANSINITDTTNALPLVTGHSVTSPAAYNFNSYPGGGLEHDVATSNTWQIEGTNTNLGTFTRNFTANWEWLMHSGSSANATLTNAQVLALANSSLAIVFPPQISFAGGGYFWYWIPTTFVQPTLFKDHATGFSIDMQVAVTQSVTNVNNIVQNYYGYRSTFSLTDGTTIDIS